MVNILFLASNPQDTQKLGLEREYTYIRESLKDAKLGKSFRLDHRWDIRADQLIDHIDTYQPNIVHISCHGTAEGQLRLDDGKQGTRTIDIAMLRKVFRLAKGNIRLVVLNACYSRKEAQELSEIIDCVIGMSFPVSDTSAIEFSGAFYRALANDNNVEDAFDRACLKVNLANLRDGTPLPFCRPGVQASELKISTLQSPTGEPSGTRSSNSSDANGGESGASASILNRPAAQTNANRAGKLLTIPDVRKLLDKHLRDDTAFDAFVLDYFDDVHRRFSSGMERLAKTNLLLRLKEPAELAGALERYLEN